MAGAIVDVKSTSGNFTTQQLAAFATNPSNGDTIVVGYALYQGPGVQSALDPVDTVGNTYAQIGTYTRNSGSGQPTIVFYAAQNIVGGASFKVTVKPNATFTACIAWALTGVTTAPYNGDFTGATGSAATVSTGVSAPAPAVSSIFIGFAALNSAASLVNGVGWNTTGVNGFTAGMNTAARVADFSANMDCFSQYKISASAEDCNWTNGGGDNWACAVASFATIVAPPAGGFPGLFLGI